MANPVGRPPKVRNPAAEGAIGRVSAPPWLNPTIMSGTGFVPRRNFAGETNAGTNYLSIERILIMARTRPLEVLTLLPEICPEIGKAVWNSLRLGCGKGSLRLKAMKVGPDGKNVQEAPDGALAIDNLFKSMPEEIGGLEDILSKNFLMILFSGMAAIEAVPGNRNAGVAALWPIDTLTMRFRRDPTTRLVYLVQRQRYVTKKEGVIGNWVPMPMDRVFYSSLDGFPDDPNGRAPMMPALMPVLENMAFIKDLLLAWHRVGTPKWDVGFDYQMWAEIARDDMGLTDTQEIIAFIEEQFTLVVEKFKNLQADDAFFHDIKSKISVNGSGGQWPNVKEIYDLLRWRIVMAMKEMPTLMGVTEGNTETWSSVDWQIYAKGLESMVAKAAAPIIKAVELHFRLLGLPYSVQAEYSPIRANQRMVDAQSEDLETRTAAYKRDQGWWTQTEASMAITGSAEVGPPDKEMLGTKPTEPPKNSSGGTVKGPSKGT